MHVPAWAQHCGEFQNNKIYFHATKHALRGNVFDVKTTSSNDTFQYNWACVSINFHKESDRCELNNSTRIQHPEEFTEVHGSVHGKKNSFIFKLYSEPFSWF